VDKISQSVEELKSPDTNKRYEACESLRVAASIPQEALDALHEAAQDAERRVADAAKKAIRVHTKSMLAPPADSVTSQPPLGFWGSWRKKLLAVLLLVVVSCVVTAVLSLLQPGFSLSEWSLSSVTLVLLLLSACWLSVIGGTLTGDNLTGWVLVGSISLLLYLVVAIVVVGTSNRRLAKVLYLALAFLLLINLIGLATQFL
jgi:hypothetical protein